MILVDVYVKQSTPGHYTDIAIVPNGQQVDLPWILIVSHVSEDEAIAVVNQYPQAIRHENEKGGGIKW